MLRKAKERRALKRRELRYVLFHEDQYKDAPDKLRKGAQLHIGRAMLSGAIIVACTGETHLPEWNTFDAYPFFKWFKDAGAPICGGCERHVLADIELYGLED